MFVGFDFGAVFDFVDFVGGVCLGLLLGLLF